MLMYFELIQTFAYPTLYFAGTIFWSWILKAHENAENNALSLWVQCLVYIWHYLYMFVYIA